MHGYPLGSSCRHHDSSRVVVLTSSELVKLLLQTATHIYNKKASVVIYKKLAAARKVNLPSGVSQEDQTLFAGVDQPDPMDVLAGIHDPGTGGEPGPCLREACCSCHPLPQPQASTCNLENTLTGCWRHLQTFL